MLNDHESLDAVCERIRTWAPEERHALDVGVWPDTASGRRFATGRYGIDLRLWRGDMDVAVRALCQEALS